MANGLKETRARPAKRRNPFCEIEISRGDQSLDICRNWPPGYVAWLEGTWHFPHGSTPDALCVLSAALGPLAPCELLLRRNGREFDTFGGHGDAFWEP